VEGNAADVHAQSVVVRAGKTKSKQVKRRKRKEKEEKSRWMITKKIARRFKGRKEKVNNLVRQRKHLRLLLFDGLDDRDLNGEIVEELTCQSQGLCDRSLVGKFDVGQTRNERRITQKQSALTPK